MSVHENDMWDRIRIDAAVLEWLLKNTICYTLYFIDEKQRLKESKLLVIIRLVKNKSRDRNLLVSRIYSLKKKNHHGTVSPTQNSF